MNMPFLKNITLCGVKHAGKTTAANALAKLTGLPFADSDDALQVLYYHETGSDLSVREIFRTLGEEGFRRLEMRALRNLFSGDGKKIVALGGGVLTNPFFTEDDREKLGFLCCVDVPDKVAYQRIMKNGLPPFLREKTDPFGAFCEMNQTRRAVFRSQADFILEITNGSEAIPEQTAERILSAYKELNHE